MENNNKFIKLPIPLGLKINEILKQKIEFVPRVNNLGIMSFEFTSTELLLIEKLNFENPTVGVLEGIEYLPNLKSLVIRSNGNPYYTQEKNIASISDKDGICISKCRNLEVLEIENQAKLSFLDVTNLKNLRGLSLIRNVALEDLQGLDQLNTLWQLDCVGNESLIGIHDLDKTIINNIELTDVGLDVLLFPDAIGHNMDGTFNEKITQVLDSLNFSWEEILSSGKKIKINTYQMIQMHKKACKALIEYVPQYCEARTTVVGIEQYLSENIKYDNDSLKSGHSHVTPSSDKLPAIVSGPLGGANGAYNAFIYNTCVCEGYTRAMQYMLKLKGIKSHNVHCISGEDKLNMSLDKGEDKYKVYNLPDDGYHSIISIDDLDYLYDDPCWNASRYQMGDKSMPWILLTKEEISRDHTLSFGEKNINNNTLNVPRNLVKIAIERINMYREKTKEINHQVDFTNAIEEATPKHR